MRASLLGQPAAVIAAVVARVVVLAHSEVHGDVEGEIMNAERVVVAMVAEDLVEESWEEQTTASAAPCAFAYEVEGADEGIDG